jgi:hypothetical protein
MLYGALVGQFISREFIRPSVTFRTLIGDFVRGGRYRALGGGLWADNSVNDPVWNQKSYVGQIKNACRNRIFLMHEV